ncbi:DUF6891 domain-containing protein [Gulosibacter chungangensis]|uniref:DUF6891 domain-containing protein n=1 Tax=Gulosibacter chungangensis TaxID=979746 RepID=A0A7J5BF89_9MICO|nr:hypothetical protein [Gulosibacter chungangensis]KAB1644931.1 hypothetical protein F8O05_01290 [Gulosibacter chungangensis]
MNQPLPALSRARFTPDVYGDFGETIMARLVLGHTRNDLAEILDDIVRAGDLQRVLPGIPNPTRQDLDNWLDDIIREYQQLVPSRSADAAKVAQAQFRLEELSIGVVFGEPAWDSGEGARRGYERAKLLSDGFGYSYTHAQDICRLAVGDSFYVGFWGMDGKDENAALEVGNYVVEEYRRAGLTVAWNGTIDDRIVVTELCWEVPPVAKPLSGPAPAGPTGPAPRAGGQAPVAGGGLASASQAQGRQPQAPGIPPRAQDPEPSEGRGFFGRLFGRR